MFSTCAHWFDSLSRTRFFVLSFFIGDLFLGVRFFFLVSLSTFAVLFL